MERFDVVTQLGKGACGSVYLVRDLKSRRLFALKKIQLDEGRKNRSRETVIKEARILSKLKHPTIVTYYDSFFDEKEDSLCILQDYCDGGTLDDKIRDCARRKEHFPEKQVVQWFMQIAMAVQYMHSKKILHRDLKTQNVFMTKTRMTCKLGDFGISKMMDTTIDVASTCVGTPCYLSPEMCQDLPYSSKADVWALGCLLFEICAHTPAFDANNLISLFYKIVKAEFEPIPEVYSADLAGVIKSILKKSPEERPSARQVLGLPYIRENLDRFITEKQLVLQMKALHVKDSPSIERSPATNPLAEITNRDRLDKRSSESPKQPRRSPAKPRRSNAPPPICIDEKSFVPHLDRPTSPTSPKRSVESPTMSARHRVLPPIPITSPAPAGKPPTGPTPTGLLHRAEGTRRSRAVRGSTETELASDEADSLSNEGMSPSHQNSSGNGQQCEDEYQDDFEAVSSDSDIEEDISAAPLDQAAAPLDKEDLDLQDDLYDYADDEFEEYASDEDLDMIVNRAREVQTYEAEAGDDDTIVDDIPDGIIGTCKNFIEQHCKQALGSDRFEQIRKRCDDGSSITEADLRHSVQRMAGSDHVETCYLLAELLSPEK